MFFGLHVGLSSGDSFPGSSETSTLISSSTSETVTTTTNTPISSSSTGIVVAVVIVVLLISIAGSVVLLVLVLLIRKGTIQTKYFVHRKQPEAHNVTYRKNPENPEYEYIGDEDYNVKLGQEDDNQTSSSNRGTQKSVSPVATVQYEDIDILAPVKKQPRKDGEISANNDDVTASDKLNTPKLGSNIASTQYEGIHELGPSQTFSKNTNEKQVSEYEDMDDLPSKPKQEGDESIKSDKNIPPLDSNEYNKLSFGKKERRQTYDPSDTTYSHWDSTGIDNSAQARSDTLPAVSAVMNKKHSKTSKVTSTLAEESNAVTGGSNNSNLSPPNDTGMEDSISDIVRKRSDTVPASSTPEKVPPLKPGRRHTQNATIRNEGKSLPGKLINPSLPPSKPSRRNTNSRLSDAPSESAPPHNSEKSQELDIYLKSKEVPHKNERSTPESDATPGLTTSTFNDNPNYSDIGKFSCPSSEQDKIVSMENIYESIHTEPIKPSLFTQSQDHNKNEEELCPYSSIYATSVLPLSQEKPLEVSIKNIHEEKTLGSGQFGKVILAKTVGLSEAVLKLGESTKKKFSVRVAVKLLKLSASENSKKKFEKEYRFMFKLNHPNVIRILGICTEKTPFIMMEYMENGDLNEVLKHQYSSIVESDVMPEDGVITVKTLIHICTQVASGLNYLATHNCIHRDIATRNCLVGEDFLVKIADFGMSRSLYDSHYYVVEGRALLPVRWMAYECYYGRFSAKSDVWAFGCTMWEVFDLAKNEPYFEMADQQVVEDALLGPERKLPPRSEGCPDSVYQVMKLCWVHEPSERATFDQLHSKLVHLNI